MYGFLIVRMKLNMTESWEQVKLLLTVYEVFYIFLSTCKVTAIVFFVDYKVTSVPSIPICILTTDDKFFMIRRKTTSLFILLITAVRLIWIFAFGTLSVPASNSPRILITVRFCYCIHIKAIRISRWFSRFACDCRTICGWVSTYEKGILYFYISTHLPTQNI